MSEVFDEKAFDAVFQPENRNDEIHAAIEQGARWQFEQDKAVIEGKDREIERLRKACVDYVTYFEESQFCKLNCDPSSNFHEPECSFVTNINKALGVEDGK